MARCGIAQFTGYCFNPKESIKLGHQYQLLRLRDDSFWRRHGRPDEEDSVDLLPLDAGRRLALRNSYRTDDLEAANHHIGTLFSPHRLAVVSRNQKLDVCIGGAGMDGASLLYHRHGAHVRVAPEPLRDCFLLQMPIRGTATVDIDAQQVLCTPRHAVMISPASRFEMEFEEGCEQLILRVDRQALEQYLELQLHRPLDAPLHFQPSVDLGDERSQALRTSLACMVAMLGGEGEEALSPLVTRGMSSLLFGALLSSLRHNHRDALDADVQALQPRYLKRALRYIEEYARMPITPEDVALAVNVSPRTLYAGFKRYLDTTPMRHMKNLRLDLAHEQLLRGTPVTSVALEFGFNHFGHFSSAYKARFRQLPSDTLARRNRLS